jgi:hypothetical protein
MLAQRPDPQVAIRCPSCPRQAGRSPVRFMCPPCRERRSSRRRPPTLRCCASRRFCVHSSPQAAATLPHRHGKPAAGSPPGLAIAARPEQEADRGRRRVLLCPLPPLAGGQSLDRPSKRFGALMATSASREADVVDAAVPARIVVQSPARTPDVRRSTRRLTSGRRGCSLRFQGRRVAGREWTVADFCSTPSNVVSNSRRAMERALSVSPWTPVGDDADSVGSIRRRASA